MKPAVLLTIFTIAALSHSICAAKPDTFRDYVSFEMGEGTVYLAPELAPRFIEKKHTDQGSMTISYKSLSGDIVVIEYDEGLSFDPSFTINIDNGKVADSIGGGTDLYVSATGNYYVITKINDYYSKPKKFILENGHLTEVHQPFYLIDNTCTTTSAAKLYTESCDRGSVVAIIPAGYSIRLLAADFSGSTCGSRVAKDTGIRKPVLPFLAATPFGLTGWVSVLAGGQTETGDPVDCISFQGD